MYPKWIFRLTFYYKFCENVDQRSRYTSASAEGTFIRTQNIYFCLVSRCYRNDPFVFSLLPLFQEKFSSREENHIFSSTFHLLSFRKVNSKYDSYTEKIAAIFLNNR